MCQAEGENETMRVEHSFKELKMAGTLSAGGMGRKKGDDVWEKQVVKDA